MNGVSGSGVSGRRMRRLAAISATVLAVAMFLPLVLLGWEIGVTMIGDAAFSGLSFRQIGTGLLVFAGPGAAFAGYFLYVQRLFGQERHGAAIALAVAALAVCGLGYSAIGRLAM